MGGVNLNLHRDIIKDMVYISIDIPNKGKIMKYLRISVFYVFAITIAFLSTHKALSKERLQPLNEINSEGYENILYIAKRCASLSLMSTFIFNNLGDEMNNNLRKKYDDFSNLMYRIAAVISIDNKSNKYSPEQIMEDFKLISEAYKQSSEDSYINTGSPLSDLIAEDTAYCSHIHKVIPKDSGYPPEEKSQPQMGPSVSPNQRSATIETLPTPPIPTPRPTDSTAAILDGNWCIPKDGCDGPYPITRQGFYTCESNCTVTNPTPVQSVDATLFDISCKGDWGDRNYQTIMKEYQDNDGTLRAAMLTPDGIENLVQCSDGAEPDQSSLKAKPEPDLSKLECDFNARLYRAKPVNPDLTDEYQELQLTDGYTSGTATITEYRQGKSIWRATGEHVCSNGAVICRLLFPMTSGEVADAPFEVLTDERDDYKTIIAPSFSQNVYLRERNATMNGKSYGGLVADFLNGFVPTDDELLLPRNVYEFADCVN